MWVMESRNVRYLPAVDHLRLLAALMVLVYHGQQLLGVPPTHWPHPRHWYGLLVSEGYSGVALFMVISGFILTYGALGKHVAYGSFLRNRALRLVPMLVVVWLLTMATGAQAISPSFLLNALVPNANAEPGGLFAVTWSVFVEIELYLAFPVLLRLLEDGGPRRLLAVLALTAGFRFASLANGGDQFSVLYVSVFSRADQFILGMIAACLLRRHESRWWALVGLLGSAGVVFVLTGFNSHGGVFASKASAFGWRWAVLSPTAEGLAWACVVFGYVALMRGAAGTVTRGLASLGATTYSVYLLHMAVIGALVTYKVHIIVAGWSTFENAVATTLLVAVPATLAAARLSYRLIELPFLRMRKRYVSDPVERPVIVEVSPAA